MNTGRKGRRKGKKKEGEEGGRESAQSACHKLSPQALARPTQPTTCQSYLGSNLATPAHPTHAQSPFQTGSVLAACLQDTSLDSTLVSQGQCQAEPGSCSRTHNHTFTSQSQPHPCLTDPSLTANCVATQVIVTAVSTALCQAWCQTIGRS